MDYKGVDYSPYKNACNEVIKEPFLFHNFKRFGHYAYVLEHSTNQHAVMYLNNLKKKNFDVNLDEIKEFCHLNDSIGNPEKFLFSKNFWYSPTSVRYICHAHFILKHIQNCKLQNVKIVEVGGGYGGLLLAIAFFAPKFHVTIQEYNIVDLKEANGIQKKYLEHFTIDFTYKLHSSDTYGKNIEGDNLFFISNYCFSEIAPEDAQKYIDILLPKCVHGLLAWNMRPLFDFGKKILNDVEHIPSDELQLVYF